MAKRNNKADFEGNLITIAMLGMMLFVILMVINGSFWYPDGHTFNSHGFTWWSFFLISISILEVVFFLLCLCKKRKKKENIWTFTLLKKLLGLLCVVGFWLVIVPVGWLVSIIWKPIIFVIGIAGLVGIYYLVNVGVAKLLRRKK